MQHQVSMHHVQCAVTALVAHVRAAVLNVATVLHTRRHRVQVSAASKLVPVAHAAEIRPSSRGNLLRQLLSANVDADLYGKELVRAVINVGMQGVSMCGNCAAALASVLLHSLTL
jgi:hypothetical protein